MLWIDKDSLQSVYVESRLLTILDAMCEKGRPQGNEDWRTQAFKASISFKHAPSLRPLGVQKTGKGYNSFCHAFQNKNISDS